MLLWDELGQPHDRHAPDSVADQKGRPTEPTQERDACVPISLGHTLGVYIRSLCPSFTTTSGSLSFSTLRSTGPSTFTDARAAKESVVEVFFRDGAVSSVRARKAGGKPPLDAGDLKLLRDLARIKGTEIADLWNDYFVLNKAITSTTITRKLQP